MMYWTTLTAADAIALFEEAERSIVAADVDLVESFNLDVTARIREAVGANLLNHLGAGDSIPRSYRQDALAIVRRDLLLRYNLPISDEREAAATRAEDNISALAREKRLVLSPDGLMPTGANQVPKVRAARRVYGTGAGLNPAPKRK